MSGFRFRALVEDRGQEQMVRGLVDRKRRARDLYIEPFPKGRGAAEKHVRDRFPTFVADLRSKRNQQSLWGVVAIDGDVEGFGRRRLRLLETLSVASMPPLSPDDRVVLLVPTRNTETWAWCLLGNAVDEREDFKPRAPAELRRLFADHWEPPQPEEPPSLAAGRVEWRRLP